MKLANARAEMAHHQPQVDIGLFRETLGSFPTGVVVATTLGDQNKPVGLITRPAIDSVEHRFKRTQSWCVQTALQFYYQHPFRKTEVCLQTAGNTVG